VSLLEQESSQKFEGVGLVRLPMSRLMWRAHGRIWQAL
jgi:hypothetical protein